MPSKVENVSKGNSEQSGYGNDGRGWDVKQFLLVCIKHAECAHKRGDAVRPALPLRRSKPASYIFFKDHVSKTALLSLKRQATT